MKCLDRDVILSGMHVDLYRRRQDGYTRAEFCVYAGARLRIDGFGGGQFTLYLDDDERQKLARALWPEGEKRE